MKEDKDEVQEVLRQIANEKEIESQKIDETQEKIKNKRKSICF